MINISTILPILLLKENFCDDNILQGYVDVAIFGKSHMYNHPTSAKVYKSTQPFDPEGVLGSLSSIFLVFLGILAGRILISFKEWKSRVQLWMAWGVILGK